LHGPDDFERSAFCPTILAIVGVERGQGGRTARGSPALWGRGPYLIYPR
jgi:hypothetical protein